MTAAENKTLSLSDAKDSRWWLPSDLEALRSSPTRHLDHAAVTAYRLGNLLAAIDPSVPGSAEACEYGVQLAETLRHDLLLFLGKVDRNGNTGSDEQPPLASIGDVDRDPSAGCTTVDLGGQPVDVLGGDVDGLPGVVQGGAHDLAPSRDGEGSVGPSPAQGSASSAGDTSGGAS